MSPVIGTPSAAASGITMPGVIIPAGSLDKWATARDNAANEPVEVSVHSDSTGYGSISGGAPPDGSGIYSWTQRLRDRIAGDGLPYGGRGCVSTNDIAAGPNPDGYSPIVSRTGFAADGNNLGVLLTDTLASTTIGDVVVVKGHCTDVRLVYQCDGNVSRFTYAVDGGATTTVTGVPAGAGFGAAATLISGLSDGDHQIEITNIGQVDTSKRDLRIVPFFLRSTGIVVNKAAISGITMGNFFGVANGNLGNYQAQAFMGNLFGVPSGVQQYGWASPEGSHPQYARCRLAVCALGINDQQAISDADSALAACANVANGVAIFARMARSAGADPLVVIPHLTLAQGNHAYAGQVAGAIEAAARAWQCPVIDFNYALGPASAFDGDDATTVNGNVHSNVYAYKREADFLWDNALSAAAYPAPS